MADRRPDWPRRPTERRIDDTETGASRPRFLSRPSRYADGERIPGATTMILTNRALLAALLAAAIAAPAGAEITGCFGRSYSPEHLASHPAQQVQEIRAKRYVEEGGAVEYYDLKVHFRDDPREFTASTYCQDIDSRRVCMIECDGGAVYPALSKDGRLQLSTDYLRAETSEQLAGQSAPEGDCAAPFTRSIADQNAQGDGIDTVFVLQPRKNAECNWQ